MVFDTLYSIFPINMDRLHKKSLISAKKKKKVPVKVLFPVLWRSWQLVWQILFLLVRVGGAVLTCIVKEGAGLFVK